MKRLLPYFGLLLLCLASFGTASAQSATQPVRYGIKLDADKITYRVYMTSATALSGNSARIASAQVTIRVPHRLAPDRFAFNSVMGRDVNGTQMLWTSSSGRVDAPTAGGSPLPYDYISFGNVFSSSGVMFDIPVNTELELFSFRRTSPCIGEVTLFENATDPFRTPNSVGTNPGNQMTLQAYGQTNTYFNNFIGGVNCETGTPDLAMGISGPATVTAGVATTYTMSVSNVGGAATSGAMSVTTLLPPGLAYGGSMGGGWACTSSTLSNGNVQVICTSSAVISASSVSSYSLVLTAASSLASANFSAAVLGGGETNTANNVASKSITVAAGPVADLSVALSGPATLTAGVASSYSVIVSNGGGAASSGAISATALLPAGFSYGGGSGFGWNVTSTTLSNGNVQIVGTSNSSIGVGGSSAFSFMLTPASNIASATFGAAVQGGGETNFSNNTASAAVTVVQAGGTINLATAISGPASVAAGSSASYAINVSNIGSAATSGPVTVTFTVPSGMTYNGFTGAGWSVASAVVGGQTIYTATLSGGINSGAAAATLNLNLSANASAGGSAVNFMGGANTMGDVNTGNNGFNAIISITGSPNLIGGFTGPASLTQGQASTFVLSLTNSGSGATTGPITSTLSLSPGVAYNGFVGPGWTVNSQVLSNGSTLVTATYSGTVAPGGSPSPLQLTVTPNAVSPGTSVTIGGGFGSPGSPQSGGSSFSQSLIVQPSGPSTYPNVNATITGPNMLTAGTSGSFTLNVGNSGDGATTGPITTTLSLPAGMTYQGFTGSGWSVSSSLQQNGTTLLTATFNALVGSGFNAQPLVLTLGSMTATSGSSLTISGSVNTSGNNNPGGNTYYTSFVIQPGGSVTPPAGQTANLSTTIRMTNVAPNQYEATSAIIVVTNSGPNNATGVMSQVTLPLGNPILSATPSGGSFNAGTAQWNIGTLAAGQSVTLTVTFSAASGGVAGVGNEIIASAQYDPNSTPNNHVDGEDDQARTCFAVPIDLCPGQTFTASISGNFTRIQWRRNGQDIPGANSTQLAITETGTYTVDTNVSCPAGGCCPIIVRSTSCCQTTVCIPIAINKTR